MSLEQVRDRYRAVNGEHEMTPADDAYVRTHYIEIPDAADLPREQILALMLDGALPLPAYLLCDGTPMVHPDFLEPVRAAGSVPALHDWFTTQWPFAEQDAAEAEWSDYLSGQYVCLRSVSPTTIQAKTRAIEHIKAAVAALDSGHGSVIPLAAAVDELDSLEPPFAAYDRLRFGGPTSRDVWVDDVRHRYLEQAAVGRAS